MRSILLASLAIAAAASSCTSYDLRAYGGYQTTEMDGSIGMSPTGNATPPVQVDVDDDLGIRDEERSLYLRAEAGLGPLRATGSAFKYDESGNGVLGSGFGDLPTGTPVASDAEFGNIKGALTWDINLGPVRLSPGLAADYLDMELDVRATNSTLAERVDVAAPVPLLFVQGEITFGIVGVTADFGWIEADIQEIDGRVLDFEALGRVRPIEHLEFFGGYRLIKAEVAGASSGQNFAGDIEFEGWMIGAGLRF
jgi:hypothetical protein